jgi:hypothetical protein
MQMTKQQQKEFRSFCDHIMREDGPASLAGIYDAIELMAEQLFGMLNRPRSGKRASGYFEQQIELLREKQDQIVASLLTLKSVDRYGFGRGELIGLLSRYHASCGESPEAFKVMIARVEALPITEDRMQRVAA